MNRLQYELSPYLISHASDPIDWYPWGTEALERARAEGKPLFIAVGTAQQDVRERSFSTAARIVGRYYVPVQVDAREHPDVAAYYIRAARALLGANAGPLQVLADSRGRPFYAAGPMSEVELAGLLSGAALHWSSDAGAYERAAKALDTAMDERAGEHCSLLPEAVEGNGQRAAQWTAPTLPERWEQHFQALLSRYDSECGGFGTGAKLLLPQEILFLLSYAGYTGQALPLDMAVFTLTQMALGGVRDHIGGGFFRGTHDRHWREPIPEKRLADQAWMLECYVTAYSLTGEELFARVARETADFVLRELRHAAGGFYTAQWSHDGFYEFAAGELPPVLGDNEAGIFCRQYDITTKPGVPNLLRGETPMEDTLLLHDLRMKLYRHRLERSSPEREETVLVGQNGVMIAALCRAGRVLGVERYLTAACNADAFLRRRLVGLTDLRRYWCHGAAAGEGALEDYAGYALGQLALYRSGRGGEHLCTAARLMARADALFSDWEGGGYYLTRGQPGLPARPKQLWDETVPSPWSVAVKVVTQLAEEIRHPGVTRRAKELAALLSELEHAEDCAYALASLMPDECNG